MFKTSICKKQQRSQLGLTLVELLVSLALGVVLVGGITKVYLENKRNYIQDEELSRLQENGRFVLNVLKREIKMAGFFASLQTDIPAETVTAITNDCRTGWALDSANSLDFFNEPTSVTSSLLGDSFAGCISTPTAIQPNTDIISIKRTAGMPTVSNGIFSSSNASTGTMKSNSFYVKVIGAGSPSMEYVGANFTAADLTPNVNPTSQISMWLYRTKIFYVRNYSVIAGDGIPTLMMVSLEDKTLVETPLIEGVEAFHIEFGVPSATSEGTPVQFFANPTDAQISIATVARVYLLMRTRNAMRDYTDTKIYRLGSKPAITPTDKRFMRRVFSTTIKIRNALD